MSEKELKPFDGPQNWDEDIMAKTLEPNRGPTHDELEISKILNKFAQQEFETPGKKIEVKTSIEAKNELNSSDLIFGRKNI